VENETGLLLDISVALAAALAGGWIASRLRLSAIVGYIVAGVVISPLTPGFGADVDRLRLVADIGVVLLLFGIGVQFSLSELLSAGPRIVAAAMAQTAAVVVAAWLVGRVAGLSSDTSLYIGAAAAITSSVVLVRVLEERGGVDSEPGRVAISWSIVQDLCAIILIVVLDAVTGGDGGSAIARDVAIAAGKTTLFVCAVLVVGLRVVPVLLGRMASEQPRELFFVAIAMLAISTALASEWIGLSLALGAFLAGLVISEPDVSHRVLADLLPTRDVFAVLFFVSVGMLIDPDAIRDHWALIAAIVVLVTVAKPLAAWLLLAGTRTVSAPVLTAALLIPAGEFSFLLANAGLERGALSEGVFGAIITATAIVIVLSPALVRIAGRGGDVGVRAGA
jgi:CPA2 family monovalent cation:H+ antiporter-2